MGIHRKKMKFFGFLLTLTAIKSDPCVIPSIFRDALDSQCESLDLDQIVSCGRKCEEEMNKCIESCVMFDQHCLLNCIEPAYEICAKSCPCIETHSKYNCSNNKTFMPTTVSTAISSTTTTTTTTTTTMTSISPPFDSIMYNTSTTLLAAHGFKRYLNVDRTDQFLENRTNPPNGTQEIFLGCGPSATIDEFIQLGAAMSPDELFEEKRYPAGIVTYAKPTRNFYTYNTKYSAKAWGFSGEPKVYLSNWDRYDCPIYNKPPELEYCLSLPDNLDKHRLSISTFTSTGSTTLYRCGQYTVVGKTMPDSYRLVMYYR